MLDWNHNLTILNLIELFIAHKLIFVFVLVFYIKFLKYFVIEEFVT
jgi:hypothetical protein